MDDGVEHPGIESAEQAAALLAAAGMPRMPARVMMALVGSPDEGYTAAELSERLGVSAAAVSGAVRYLVTMRFAQRLSSRGDRRDRYDLVDDAWAGMITANAPLYAALATHMDRIADENTDAPTSVTRAHEIADFLRFLAERVPQLADEWRRERAEPVPDRAGRDGTGLDGAGRDGAGLDGAGRDGAGLDGAGDESG